MQIKNIIIITLIILGLTIVIINIPKGEINFEAPESYWYICQEDVPLCQQERHDSCKAPKLICHKCCVEWGLD